MRKIFFISTLALLLLASVSVYLLPKSSRAGGFDANFDITASPNPATTDGQTMTVTVHVYYYECSVTNNDGHPVSLDPNYCTANGYGSTSVVGQPLEGVPLTVSGSGNTVSTDKLYVDSSGYGSFTIKSTVAETKTIQILTGGGGVFATKSVTFTAPASKVSAPAPTTTQKATTPSTSTSPKATTPPAPTTPNAPTLATVSENATQLDTAKPITLDQTKPLILSGTTVPNGVVTLTIHSTPRTVTVTADKDGHWNYSVSGLDPGEHYVEAAVTDPTTNKTSSLVKLVAFTVTAAPAVAPPTVKTMAAAPANPQSPVLMIAAGVIVLAAGCWYLWWRKKRAQSGPTIILPPKTPPANGQSDPARDNQRR